MFELSNCHFLKSAYVIQSEFLYCGTLPTIFFFEKPSDLITLSLSQFIHNIISQTCKLFTKSCRNRAG
jgi:hypothetical protein